MDWLKFGKQYADEMEFRTINGVSSKIIEYYCKFHGKGQPFPIIDNHTAVRLIGQIYQTINNEYPTESDIRRNASPDQPLEQSEPKIRK